VPGALQHKSHLKMTKYSGTSPSLYSHLACTTSSAVFVSPGVHHSSFSDPTRAPQNSSSSNNNSGNVQHSEGQQQRQYIMSPAFSKLFIISDALPTASS